MFNQMKSKQNLLEELMEELDGKESERLKPKSRDEEVVAVTDPEIDEKDGDVDGASGDDDELNDDELKMLLKHYLGGK